VDLDRSRPFWCVSGATALALGCSVGVYNKKQSMQRLEYNIFPFLEKKASWRRFPHLGKRVKPASDPVRSAAATNESHAHWPRSTGLPHRALRQATRRPFHPAALRHGTAALPGRAPPFAMAGQQLRREQQSRPSCALCEQQRHPSSALHAARRSYARERNESDG
jgi:hypothetical protein